jgi:O-antigen biosynthesis protein
MEAAAPVDAGEALVLGGAASRNDGATGKHVDMTVLILSYNVRELLSLALRTSLAAAQDLPVEILVVDNASPDGSADMVESEFPQVRLVRSGRNLGFAGGNNLGMRAAHGELVLLLNPDVLVHPKAFAQLIDYMKRNPEVGAAGGRIINRDGTIDHAAKRGFPSPSAAFYRMVGLSYLFPKSKRFGRYSMTYADENEEIEVDGLSGAFMCVRRSVIEEIGGLDEDFFMYGEDLDWSYRIQQAGWKLGYVPSAEIVHFKGESTRKMPRLRQMYEFHRAMYIFVKKHIAPNRNPIVVSFIEMGIVLRGVGVTIWRFLLSMLRPLLDIGMVAAALGLAFGTRMMNGWTVPGFRMLEWGLIALAFFGASLIGSTVTRLYRQRSDISRRDELLRAFGASMVGATVCIVAVFFIKSINFSRIVIGLTWMYATILNVGWRWLITPRSDAAKGHGLLVGCGQRAVSFLTFCKERSPSYHVIGVVRGPEDSSDQVEVCGYPVIGDIEDLPILLRRLKVDDLIVAREQFQYRDLLALTRRGGEYPRRVRLVPDGDLGVLTANAQPGITSQQDWPLINVDLPRRTRI